MHDTSIHVEQATDSAGTKGLRARFVVQADPGRLLALLWNTEHFPRLYPDIREVRVLRDGSMPHPWQEVAYRVNAVVKEVRYVLRRELDPTARTISWRELSGDLARVRGAWAVSPQGEASLLSYEAFVDIGWFVPTRLVRDGAMKKMTETAERIRRVAAEGRPIP
jgi:ribosome-associated toxin RatA of RatAB toxin-antitoxin module